MQITKIDKTLANKFRECLFRNECNGQKRYVYMFSDPDGVRTGKSGYSFGVCQFDVKVNPNALNALMQMDFTVSEIRALQDQDIDDMRPYNNKLKQNTAIVDIWDEQQIYQCLSITRDHLYKLSIDVQDEETFLHIADYHNQFYFSIGGKLWGFLKENREKTVTPEMIREYKYTTTWGIKQKKRKPIIKDDVYRRYINIVNIMRKGEQK